MDTEGSKNAKTEAHQATNRYKLEMITPLVQQINCLNKKQIAEICINQIRELIGARYVSLYILDEASEMLHLEKHNHPFLINNIVSLNQLNPSPMIQATRSKELVVIEDIDAHKKPVIKKSSRQFAKNYKSNSCIIAPLICQGRVVGVLNMADKISGDVFSSDDIVVVELFRQLVGASIGNIALFEKTQRQAKTDGLTSLVNHKTFYDTLEKELRRLQRYGGQLSVIMIDVDNLKTINDTYGHRAGDMAIKYVSRTIMACIRKIDTAARYGGDEFVVILPNTSLDAAMVAAKRMLEMVSQDPIVWDGREINISISIGLGRYDASNTPEDVTRFSDEALYAAKQAGKNTIHVFKFTGIANSG